MKKTSALLLATSYLLLTTSIVRADGTETACTPVYGMANTCAEHVVVDTGLETGAFLNAGALTYILGLASFIKAKRG